MQLMMGGINGNYLTNITLNAAAETQGRLEKCRDLTAVR